MHWLTNLLETHRRHLLNFMIAKLTPVIWIWCMQLRVTVSTTITWIQLYEVERSIKPSNGNSGTDDLRTSYSGLSTLIKCPLHKKNSYWAYYSCRTDYETLMHTLNEPVKLSQISSRPVPVPRAMIRLRMSNDQTGCLLILAFILKSFVFTTSGSVSDSSLSVPSKYLGSNGTNVIVMTIRYLYYYLKTRFHPLHEHSESKVVNCGRNTQGTQQCT